MFPHIPLIIGGFLIGHLFTKTEGSNLSTREDIRAAKYGEKMKALDAISAELRWLTNESDADKIKKYIADVNKKASTPQQLSNSAKVDISTIPGTQATTRNIVFELIGISIKNQEAVKQRNLTAVEVNDIIWKSFHDASVSVGGFF